MFRKQVGSVTVAAMFLLVTMGCSESENPFQQYGEELIRAPGRAEKAKNQADLQALKTAIQQYQIERGSFPASLTDLPLVQNQGIDPTLYVYDPAAGNVRLR